MCVRTVTKTLRGLSGPCRALAQIFYVLDRVLECNQQNDTRIYDTHTLEGETKREGVCWARRGQREGPEEVGPEW